MFNNNPLTCEFFIIGFLSFGKFMILAFLYGYQAICMKFFNPKITQVRLHYYCFIDISSDSVLIQLKIMHASFCLPDVNNSFIFPVYNHLCFYCMAFFLPE